MFIPWRVRHPLGVGKFSSLPCHASTPRWTLAADIVPLDQWKVGSRVGIRGFGGLTEDGVIPTVFFFGQVAFFDRKIS